jgi:hypothetical protein
MGPVSLSLGIAVLMMTLAPLPGSAQTVTELDQIVDDFRGVIPPEHLEAVNKRQNDPEDGFVSSLDRADCRAGKRFGSQLAQSVLSRLKPSCDKLLAPSGDEWITSRAGG